jgi:hypothetical protein
LANPAQIEQYSGIKHADDKHGNRPAAPSYRMEGDCGRLVG